MPGQAGGFGGGFGGGGGGAGGGGGQGGRTSQQVRQDLLQHVTEDSEDEARKDGSVLGTRKKFDEFECPTCEAYNPHTDFGNEDEITCAYCGLAFIVEVTDEAKLKLRDA